MDVIERLKRQRGEEEWNREDDLIVDDELDGFIVGSEEELEENPHVREQ